jgi:hypothetical protein
MANFFQRFQIKKRSEIFCDLVAKGEIEFALTFFEDALASYDSDVDKNLRAIYYFYRWVDNHDEEYLRKVELLAIAESRESQIVRASRIMRRHTWEAKLAMALRQQNPQQLLSAQEPAFSTQSAQLQLIATIILQSFSLKSRDNKSRFAHKVQKDLQRAGDFQDGIRQICHLLLLWSLWINNRFVEISKRKDLLQSLPLSEQQSFILALSNAWGHAELESGNLAGALNALGFATEYKIDKQSLQRMTFNWSIAALQQGQEQVLVDWLSQRVVVEVMQVSPTGRRLHLLLDGLSNFQIGRFSYGRGKLKLLSVTNEQEQTSGFIAQFLRGLSLLAETQTWTMPDSLDNEANIVVQNRALWHGLRTQLEQIITILAQSPPEHNWRAHLLLGLVAFVDSNTTLSTTQLEKFSQSIEKETDDKGRKRLRTVEGTLVTRSLATEEAIKYIHQKSYRDLQTLQERVLVPLGDAIASSVRAAIHMTLWEGNPDYNPLPYLQQAAATANDEKTANVINECLRQVQAVNTMNQLNKLCTLPSIQANVILPSQTNLSFSENAIVLGALATAVIRLRQQNWPAALDALAVIQNENQLDTDIQQMVTYVRFYASWQTDNIEFCQIVSDNRYLERSSGWRRAVDTKLLLEALHDENVANLMAILNSYGFSSSQATRIILSVVTWLIKQEQVQLVIEFLKIIQHQLGTNDGKVDSDNPQLSWLLIFLTGIFSARVGQYTASINSFEAFIKQPIPPDEDRQVVSNLHGWAKLFRLQANLALVSQSNDDVVIRWPTVQRSLISQAETLRESPVFEAYGFLVTGLISFLTTDTLIDDSIISKLAQAQQVLQLSKYATFLEQVIAQLNWRRKVLSDFWASLRYGDLRQSRGIYLNEIKPKFGDRVPQSIQLGMVIVDWDSGSFTAPDLLKRLAILGHESTLSASLIQQVEDYILETERTRQFTKLVEQKNYEGIIDFIENGKWAESMPVPVAIALLNAFYKKKRHEDAERFGRAITDTPRLAGWVRDYGYFILGYLRYDNEMYEEAATAFEKIHVSELFGKHNTDKYWAASHYARGLQYLDGDKKEEAFDCFRRSLSQRGTSKANVALTSLFTYFGWQNLEKGNGNRAERAFELMKDSLEGSDNTPEAVKGRLIAEMGILFVRSKMGETDKNLPSGNDFLELVTHLHHHKDILNSQEYKLLERTCRVLAICQTFYRQNVLTKPDISKSRLHKYISEQVAFLEKLPVPHGGKDPVLIVLRGLLYIYLTERPNSNKGFQTLMEAVRLGLQSQRLNGVLQQLNEINRLGDQAKTVSVNLLDIYLSHGNLPPHINDNLNRNGYLLELYQLDRGYTVQEVLKQAYPSSITIREERIKHIKALLQDEKPIKKDDYVYGLLEKMNEYLESLKDAEEALDKQEEKLMQTLIERIQ